MANKRPIVTLMTDFGNVDGYVGVVKGVLLSIAPDLEIIDITHEIEPWNIGAAAWIAANTYRYFPSDCVHMAVVDPGVGTDRRPIAVVSDVGMLVGPDNGIFSAVTAKQDDLEVYELTEAQFWLQPVSATFHARDIFAPVAARLATGTPASKVGKSIQPRTLTSLPLADITYGENWIEGEIVYVDRFGNLISNIPASQAPADATCLINGKVIGALSPSYGAAAGGQPVVISGSHGFVEIGLSQGSATSALQAAVGSLVRMETR